jgi:predicted nucleic acid-binding protein
VGQAISTSHVAGGFNSECDVVIVDNTVWIDYVWIDYLGGSPNQETERLHRELSQQRLGLTDLILCEVLQGIREETAFRRIRDYLMTLQVFPTGGPEVAIAAAENDRTLRRKAVTIRKTIDCWIATFCSLSGHSLLHRERDFDGFEKLLGRRVVHP